MSDLGDRAERGLAAIAEMLGPEQADALRASAELANHVRLGLANGIAPDQLETILVHLAPYVGLPATSAAARAMRQVLKEAGRPEQG